MCHQGQLEPGPRHGHTSAQINNFLTSDCVSVRAVSELCAADIIACKPTLSTTATVTPTVPEYKDGSLKQIFTGAAVEGGGAAAAAAASPTIPIGSSGMLRLIRLRA